MNLIEQCDVDLQAIDMSVWKAPVAAYIGERSGGVHLTQIIAKLWFGSLPAGDPARLQKEAELQEEIGDIHGERSYPLRMALGVAWERWAAGLYPEMVWQPGEFTRDGITGSPDGISEYCGMPVIDEFKFTFKSSNPEKRPILRETLWMWQISGYLAITGSTLARLHTLYVNGDYRHPYTPIYRLYTLELKEEERERLWTAMFVPVAQEMSSAGI